MKKFGKKLRILRQRQGLSQTQLGDMLGIKQSHVGKIERGENMPSVEVLVKITQLLNVSADVLITDNLDLDS